MQPFNPFNSFNCRNPITPIAAIHSFLLRAYRYAAPVSPKPRRKFALVLVTAPDLKTARALARAALTARLIACANLIPKIESHYWWQGKIQTGAEVLLVLKTTVARLPALKRLVVAKHPYDTPEFVALEVKSGNQKYLNWLAQAVF